MGGGEEDPKKVLRCEVSGHRRQKPGVKVRNSNRIRKSINFFFFFGLIYFVFRERKVVSQNQNGGRRNKLYFCGENACGVVVGFQRTRKSPGTRGNLVTGASKLSSSFISSFYFFFCGVFFFFFSFRLDQSTASFCCLRANLILLFYDFDSGLLTAASLSYISVNIWPHQAFIGEKSFLINSTSTATCFFFFFYYVLAAIWLPKFCFLRRSPPSQIPFCHFF